MPISLDFGSLPRAIFGFLIPPMALSFSRSLSVLTPTSKSGVWKFSHGNGSSWSSLHFFTLGVSTNAMAAERAAFNLAGYSPKAFEALSLSPLSFVLHLWTSDSCFARYLAPSDLVNSWMGWSHLKPSRPARSTLKYANLVGFVVSAPNRHWSKAQIRTPLILSINFAYSVFQRSTLSFPHDPGFPTRWHLRLRSDSRWTLGTFCATCWTCEVGPAPAL